MPRNRWVRDHNRERAISSLEHLAAYLADGIQTEMEGLYLAMSEQITELQNVTQAIVTAVQDVGANVTRIVADFEAAHSSGDTVALQNAIDALKQIPTALSSISTTIVAADPAVAPADVPPTS